MESKNNKYSFIIFILFISLFILTKASNLKNKKTLRQLWNEDIEFGRNGIDNEENDSIEHCHSADYKYKSYFAFGQNYNFAQNDTGTLNIYNAVSI